MATKGRRMELRKRRGQLQWACLELVWRLKVQANLRSRGRHLWSYKDLQ